MRMCRFDTSSCLFVCDAARLFMPTAFDMADYIMPPMPPMPP